MISKFPNFFHLVSKILKIFLKLCVELEWAVFPSLLNSGRGEKGCLRLIEKKAAWCRRATSTVEKCSLHNSTGRHLPLTSTINIDSTWVLYAKSTSKSQNHVVKSAVDVNHCTFLGQRRPDCSFLVVDVNHCLFQPGRPSTSILQPFSSRPKFGEHLQIKTN